MSEVYIGYSSVQKFHALSEQLDFILFYAAMLLIFLDFLHELLQLLQNYLFLEVFQMLTNCHCKPSEVHVGVIYTIIRCFITAHPY